MITSAFFWTAIPVTLAAAMGTGPLRTTFEPRLSRLAMPVSHAGLKAMSGRSAALSSSRMRWTLLDRKSCPLRSALKTST